MGRPHDSLRRGLAGQHADTLRLQTLMHLFDIADNGQDLDQDLLRAQGEALALATKLHYPERLPLRWLMATNQLDLPPSPNLPAVRDSLLMTLRDFDALGDRPLFYFPI